MVIVFTGGGFNTSDLVPFIAKAIKSDKPIAANLTAIKQLKSHITNAATAPQLHSIAKLPNLALTISGKKYQLPVNTLDLTNIQFLFNNSGKAKMNMIWTGKKVKCIIGLDGKDRFTYNPIVRLPQACLGEWINDDTFSVKIDLVSAINFYNVICKFVEKGRKINITISEGTGLNNETIVGEQTK